MKTITFHSNNEDKIDLLIKVAKEMGIEPFAEYSNSEDDYCLPGPKISNEKLEEWLAKEDGPERYTPEQMLDYVKKH